MLRGMQSGLLSFFVLCTSVQSYAEPAQPGSPSSDTPTTGAATQTAPAQSGAAATARDVSREKFQEGVRAFEAGRYKDALDALLEADRALHMPVFSYNIAITYDAMGDVASALRWYRGYLRELPTAEDRADTSKRISALESALEQRGIQQVTVLSRPDGATVSVDGNPVGVTPWTGELHPGRHRIALTMSGRQSIEKLFDLQAHRSQDVSIDLPPATQAASSSAPDAKVDTNEQGGAKVRPLTIVTLAAGGVVLGAALGFEVARAGAVDSAKKAPQVDYRDELDKAQSYQTTARVLAAVGGALVVGGGVLLALDLTRSPEASTVEVGYTGSGFFVSKRGVF